MEINDTNLKLLILDIIEELKRLRGLWKDEFRDVPPILWFGDIHNNPQVLVVSANPSRPDQPNSNPRIPYCKKWNIDQPDVEELMKDYNNYFEITHLKNGLEVICPTLKGVLRIF